MNWNTPNISYKVLAIILMLGAVMAGLLFFGSGTIDADTTSQNTSQPIETIITMPSLTSKPTDLPEDGSAAHANPTPSAIQDSPAVTTEPSTIYTVENQRFGIDNTGKNARATTDGINKALEWAKSGGYETIKFTEGTYLIQCKWNNRFAPPNDGVLVPSDLTLDLSGCTFIMETNSYPEYAVFGIVNQGNVTIKNGTLIGDLERHVFTPSQSSPTHEYGFGICISASRNVLIENMTIKNMTGDGIIIEGSYSKLADGGSLSSNIRIVGCDISHCRRQGISVVGALDSEIAHNKIYDIAGTEPGYGIVVKSELDYAIDRLAIYDNNIFNCEGGAISCNKGSNCEIYSNVCSGNIIVVYASYVNVFKNVIQNSFIRVMSSASDVTVEDNILDKNSWLIIE